MGYRFIYECDHARGKSYVSIFPSFSVIFAGLRFVEIPKFCYHGNVTLRLLSIGGLVGDSVTEWLDRWTCNPEAPNSNPALTACQVYTR